MPAMLFAGMPYRGHRPFLQSPEPHNPEAIRQSAPPLPPSQLKNHSILALLRKNQDSSAFGRSEPDSNVDHALS